MLQCAPLSAFVFDAQLHPHQVMAESLGGASVAERAGQTDRSARLNTTGTLCTDLGYLRSGNSIFTSSTSRLSWRSSCTLMSSGLILMYLLITATSSRCKAGK